MSELLLLISMAVIFYLLVRLSSTRTRDAKLEEILRQLRAQNEAFRQRDSAQTAAIAQLQIQNEALRQRAEARIEQIFQLQTQVENLQESDARKSALLSEWQEHLNRRVQESFNTWRENECEAIRREQREIARREALASLNGWKSEQEHLIREDARQRSQAVIIGKVTEHFVPYLPDFPFNPKDARFIGSPVDFIVFDGMSDEEVREVVFVEVKTGQSAALTTRQRQIRNAVQSGRVRWRESRISHDLTQESSFPATVEAVEVLDLS
ncbi:MAG TPA: Holliday junction resolvase-like protein [Blastocatellia bacterium]|nr:Holliday junction resolvase-like protein [Blastocatellia bacterium]